MEEKVKGIVLKLSDYKEADKLASIFTLEQGVITAKFTGVKKEKAKLKALAQPFVFAEFILNKKGNVNQVINATLIDNFYNILNNYNKTICAYIVLDIINSILPKNKIETNLFLITVNALKNIETQNEYEETIKYILQFISFSGMGLEFPESEYVYLDKTTGDFSLERNLNSTQIDKKVYKILKNIAKNMQINEKNAKNLQNFENFSNNEIENETILKQILRMLHNIIFIKFNEDIKSFQFI